MEIQWIDVDLVVPYARNARVHDQSIDKLVASLKEYGWQQPITVDSQMVIITGHNRYNAARRLQHEKIPVRVCSELSEAQIKAYRIADNAIAEKSSWNRELLEIEIKELEGEIDLGLTGFDLAEIESLLAEDNETEKSTEEKDYVPEPKKEIVSRHGDIWILGNHRLMCGDATSEADIGLLMADEQADLLFTDPPYGMSHKSKKLGGILADDKRGVELQEFLCRSMKQAVRFSKDDAHFYICFTWRSYVEFQNALEHNGLSIKACICWDKQTIGLGMVTYRPQHEFIFYCHHNKQAQERWQGSMSESDVWSIPRVNNQHYIHPTQKPVEVVGTAIMNSSIADDIVLDLFGGSGSTLIACESIGRKARLLELDPQYVDVIIRRYQEYSGKDAFLEGSEQNFIALQEERHETSFSHKQDA